jgi:hypothetical protein
MNDLNFLERGSNRGLSTQLMNHDALGAHARDELGISATLAARPVQAAFASTGTFAVGASLPFLIVVLSALPQPSISNCSYVASPSDIRYSIRSDFSGSDNPNANNVS